MMAGAAHPMHFCMDSDWLKGIVPEDQGGMGSSSPSEELIIACPEPMQAQQAADRRLRPQHDQPLKCPRCDSTHTKFCYYNNYSRKQPRYFCRACRRHWTEGGTLRDVPVGGGRKNRRNGGGGAKGGAKAPSTVTAEVSTAATTAIQGSGPGALAGAVDAFIPADILRQMLSQSASFTASGGGGGYGIDLSAWQQMTGAAAAPQGGSDVGEVGGTAPAPDANCGTGAQYWSGWNLQDDMPGFDGTF